jgi:hypothetical protein
MALKGSIVLNGPSGTIANYYSCPRSINLATSTHTSAGIYTVSFLTEKNLENNVPHVVNVTLVDASPRILNVKLPALPSIVPYYQSPVRYLYVVSFTIAVSQVQCINSGFATGVAADPDTAIMIALTMKEMHPNGRCGRRC